MPRVRERRLELAHDPVAVGRRRIARHEVVVVEIHAVRAELAELLDDVDGRDRRAHRIAERIAADVADGPEAEGEVVLGVGE